MRRSAVSSLLCVGSVRTPGRRTFFRVLLMGFALGCVTFVPALGQAQESSASDAFRLVSEGGIPNDWTHRYIVFSSAEAKIDAYSLHKEPRYWLQQLQRHGSQSANAVEGDDAAAILAAQLSRLNQRKFREREFQDDQEPDRGDGDVREIWRSPPRHRKFLERDWSESLGVSVTSVIRYPAKFSFSSSNPDCVSDFVAVTQSGGGKTFPGTFNVIGFNNLYVSSAGGSQFCSGTAPIAIFEYNASSAGGALNGAPVLSLDGKLIAFVETAAAIDGGAVFHVLKWHSGDVNNSEASFPLAFNTSALSNCAANGAVAPCEYNLQYTPTALRRTAVRTAPFVDYISDTAYLTDDAGNVYAVTPVFNATPANPPAVVTGWPVAVGSGAGLLAPVYDASSRNVFVGSFSGTEFFVKTIGSTTGTCSAGSPPCSGSTSISFGTSSAIDDATIVDSSTGRVFITGRRTSGTPGTFLAQADTELSAASIVRGTIGTVGGSAVFSGAPDNNYYTSVSTGKFYVCGVDTNRDAQLYAFGFNSSGVMNATPVGGPLQLGDATSTNASCSTGLTEVFNQSSAKDWLFAGLGGRCAGAVTGTTGCVMSLDITSGFPAALTALLVETNASSGIIVDNVTDVGASITTDIYFHVTGPQSCADYLGTKHSTTCLVSATQSGLQ